jgi:metal-responsive CopG/Arc/MetJ family transcriptional regulator
MCMGARDYTTINIPLDVATKIDRILAEQGYASRSEFVRDAIRQHLKTFEQSKEAT